MSLSVAVAVVAFVVIPAAHWLHGLDADKRLSVFLSGKACHTLSTVVLLAPQIPAIKI